MGEIKKRSQKKKRSRTWIKILIPLIVLLIIGIGGYAYSVYHSFTHAVESMHEPIERNISEKRMEQIVLEEKEPFSVLLLGVDEREDDVGRSDTMIVLTVNPNSNSIKMVSIPRDTRTEIVGKGFEDKINHAYAYGRERMAIDTVENFLDIPIDYYIKINMEGFQDIVDAVGGITVYNPFSFSEYGYDFPEGEMKLNGEEALIYVRMRKLDPAGDFGRQKRQQEVIEGVIEKGASFSSLTRFNNIFKALGENIKTNLTFEEMVDIQKNYKDTRHNIEQIEIKGSGEYIQFIYYYIVPPDEQERVQNILQEHLELQDKNKEDE